MKYKDLINEGYEKVINEEDFDTDIYNAISNINKVLKNYKMEVWHDGNKLLIGNKRKNKVAEIQFETGKIVDLGK